VTQARRGVRLAVLLVAVVVASVLPPTRADAQTSPAFPSDDFDRTTLGSAWTVVDPVGDGTVTMVGAGTGDARLELSVPGGVNHDPWNANRALRVMRSSADTDFTAVLKAESVPTQKYQMQGLLVQQDGDDWLRFNTHYDGSSLRVYAATTAAGTSTGRINKAAPAGGAPYLRVARAGDTWTLSTSVDGSSWTTAGSFTHAIDVSAVGPFAGNSNTSTPSIPAHTAVIDYLFEASAPIVPEDGGGQTGSHTLTTGTSGPGTVVRSPDQPTYTDGQTVTLTATPDSGAVFTGWSGDVTGGANPVVVTMDGDKAVTATFAADSTPPVISSVSVSPGSTSAVVTWTTDEPASSSVSAGPTPAYELGAFGDASLVTTHSVTVTGLTPGSTYHHRVSSTNGAGLTGTGSDATFTTASGPTVAFASDDFDRTSLGPTWTVVDPVGNSSVALSGAGTPDARLALSVPAGSAHDAWQTNRSLRVVQQAQDVDFTAEVRFDSMPTQKYQMQGLLVQQDADDWLRFDLFHNGSGLRAYAASTAAGTSTAKLNAATTNAPSLWLRVQRAGDDWTLRTSTTGQSWTTVGTFTRALDVAAVGPFAGNSGSPVPAFTALVDYVFETSTPIEPEDTPDPVVTHQLTTSVSGDGSIARSPDAPEYADGTEVTLTAVPGPASTFTGWSGDLAGGDNPAVITMDADKTVTATFATDTQPPVITGIEVAPSTNSAVVRWATDEPAGSSVAAGTTTGYELGAFGSPHLTRDHSVTLTGLTPGTTNHFAVSSTDGSGLTTTAPDATFATPASAGPAIDAFYGDDQPVGATGQPQTAFNVLGNVSDPDGVAALSYTLNGGASRALTIGPNSRRLQFPGDFNADIAYADLAAGDNQVAITGRDALGNLNTTIVHLERRAGSVPLPYATDWADADRVGDGAQVVDGRWSLDGATVRPVQLGYDRVVAVGDVSWHDYEMTVAVTPHGVGPGAGSALSGPALVGFGLNWRGHTQAGSEQPPYYWYPTGALGWYRWYSPTPKFELRGNGDSPVVRHNRFQLAFDRTYVFKARSETVPGGVRYSWKVWPQGSAEPAAWDLTLVEDAGPATGSVILIAHHVDVQFGDVTVRPVP
jgi:regulation of enolase protein 1 (concanavalin A-like superfamily)